MPCDLANVWHGASRRRQPGCNPAGAGEATYLSIRPGKPCAGSGVLCKSQHAWQGRLIVEQTSLRQTRCASVYWLFPLKNYKTFCPYLVGDYDEVSDYLRRYLSLGYDTLILDVPEDEADLMHTMRAINPLR